MRRDCVRCCISVEATPAARLRRLRERWLLTGSNAAGVPTLPDREDEEEPTALDRLETFERTIGEVAEFYRGTTEKPKWIAVQSWTGSGEGGEVGGEGGCQLSWDKLPQFIREMV